MYKSLQSKSRIQLYTARLNDLQLTWGSLLRAPSHSLQQLSTFPPEEHPVWAVGEPHAQSPASKQQQLHKAQANGGATEEPDSSCCIPAEGLPALFLIPEAAASFRRQEKSTSCSRTVQTCSDAWRGVLLSSLSDFFFPFCPHPYLLLTASTDWNYILIALVKDGVQHFTFEFWSLHTSTEAMNVILMWGGFIWIIGFPGWNVYTTYMTLMITRYHYDHLIT